MSVSTHTKRGLARLAVVAGAMMLVPLGQAASGPAGSPDVIDCALAAQQAKIVPALDASERAMQTRPESGPISMLDARERASLTRRGLASLGDGPPDVFERAMRAHEQSLIRLSSMPDVLERTAAAGPAQYLSPATTASGFDWSDFGIGAGAGVGFMLVLVGLGVGVLAVRHSHTRVTNA